MSRSTTPKRPKQRTLSITFNIDGQPYTISPLDCEPDIGSRAVRFAKQGGDGAVYDLYHGRYGWACQCLGFERYGYCRHSQALMKAAQLFGTAAPGRPTAPAGFMEVLSPGQETGGTAEAEDDADRFARVPSDSLPRADNGGKWPSDAQLAEMMELAPPMPAPTEEEVNAMARYFEQE
jgi:hypothetical protein